MKFVSFEPAASRRLLFGQLLWFGLWLVTTVFGAMLTPSPDGHGTHTRLGLAPCPSVLTFNRPCPGCGLTTSFSATIHGDVVHAIQSHPFGPVLYLLLTASALACGYGYLKKLRFNTDSRPFNVSLAVFVGAFLVFGAIRFTMMPNFDKRFQRAPVQIGYLPSAARVA